MELLQKHSTTLAKELPGKLLPLRQVNHDIDAEPLVQDTFHYRGHRSDCPSQSLTSCIVNLMKCLSEASFVSENLHMLRLCFSFERQMDR